MKIHKWFLTRLSLRVFKAAVPEMHAKFWENSFKSWAIFSKLCCFTIRKDVRVFEIDIGNLHSPEERKWEVFWGYLEWEYPLNILHFNLTSLHHTKYVIIWAWKDKDGQTSSARFIRFLLLNYLKIELLLI